MHTASYSSWENRESLNCLLRKSRTWRRKEMWPWSLVSCCLFLFQLRYDLVVVFILIKVLSFSFDELSKKKHTPKQFFLYPYTQTFCNLKKSRNFLRLQKTWIFHLKKRQQLIALNIYTYGLKASNKEHGFSLKPFSPFLRQPMSSIWAICVI